MKRFYVLLSMIIVSFTLLTTTTEAAVQSEKDVWEELSDTVYRALQLTKEKKYAEARQFLDRFSSDFLQANREHLRLSMLELRVLTVSYDHAKKALAGATLSHESRVHAVLQLYFVIDALKSEHDPLWRKTEKQVMQPFYQMKQAAKRQEARKFQYYLNEFLNEYETIHPAMNVDLEDFVMVRLDSRIQFLMKHRSHFFSDPHYVKQLDEIEKELKALFAGKLRQSLEPAVPGLILSIGGFIVLTLFYAGWKKYRAEKAYRRRAFPK